MIAANRRGSSAGLRKRDDELKWHSLGPCSEIGKSSLTAMKPRSICLRTCPASPGPSADFLRLAREQGVRPVARLEDLMGGWPVEEREDGFEEMLMEWRSLHMPRS